MAWQPSMSPCSNMLRPLFSPDTCVGDNQGMALTSWLCLQVSALEATDTLLRCMPLAAGQPDSVTRCAGAAHALRRGYCCYYNRLTGTYTCHMTCPLRPMLSVAVNDILSNDNALLTALS